MVLNPPYSTVHSLAVNYRPSIAIRVRAIFVACSVVSSLIVAAGCGPQKQVLKDRAVVSGTVSFDGKPLPGGVIRFLSADGQVSTSAMIYEGGRYKTDRAPIGEMIVTIDTQSLQYGNMAAYVPIPAAYNHPSTSGLTANLQPGENENVDFALEKTPSQ
jgi:hypothetical protein